MDIKYCCSCGAKLPVSAAYCSSCGVKQISVDDLTEDKAVPNAGTVTVQVASKPTKAAKKEKKPSKFSKNGLIALIRNSVIVAVAVVMLIMAFMPVTKFSVSEAIGINTADVPELSMNISPVRAVSLMISSFKSVESDEMYDDLMEIVEDIENKYDNVFDELKVDYWEDLKSSDQDKIMTAIDELLYESYKLGLSVDEISIAPQLYVAGALSLVYIGTALALLVLAVLNILSTFSIIRSEGGALLKWTVTLLTLIPAFTVVLNYVYYVTFTSIGSSGANASSMAGAAITTIAVSSLAILLLFVLRMIFANGRSLGVMIRRGVALAISIVVICLAFTPVLTTTVEITPSNSISEREFKYSVHAPLFVSFGFLTEEEWIDAEELYKLDKYEKQDNFIYQIEDFEDLTKKQLSSSQGEIINASVVSSLYFCYIGEAMAIAPFLMIFQLIAVIGAGIVMWQLLRYFADGRLSRAFTLSGRITAVITAVLAVAANIVLAVFLADATNKYAPVEFSCAIAIGGFFFLAFAIAMLALPVSMKRSREENSIPVSIFSKKAECCCCCDTVSDNVSAEEDASVVADASTEETASEQDFEDAKADDIEDIDDDVQDIDDLKALDGFEE